MTFEKKFSTLKTKFNKVDVKKLENDFAIQLTMTDEDCGGTFYISFINGSFSVEPYDYVDNNAAITGTAAALAKIAGGKVDKSIDIFGSVEVVNALAAAYPAPAKKCAAKTCAKTAEKKTAAKSTAKKSAKK